MTSDEKTPANHPPAHLQHGISAQPGRQHTTVPRLNWLLILGLGLLALARPVTNTVLDQLGIDLGPIVPLGWTMIISVVWISAVGLTRTSWPVATLLLTGIAYGVFAIVLSGILSPILLGELRGPLTTPIGVVAVLATNAVWGVITGGIALALQRARGLRTGPAPTRS